MRIKRNGSTLVVSVVVIPLKQAREPCFLIMFEDAQRPMSPAVQVAGKSGKSTARSVLRKEENRRIAELELELAELREYVQAAQEQNEAHNEELQAANEEVQSTNEELQSINEELETSKEELESANEELTTLNEEMAHRNVELARLNNDLVNLQTSARLAILLLGRDLTIRRFSQQAEKHFDLLAADIGRPISHIRHELVKLGDAAVPASQWAPVDLESLCADVISEVREQELEVLYRNRRWLSLRARPYMTLDNKVDGVVLVFVDIDELKRSEQRLAAARAFAENTVNTVREPLLVLDRNLRVESANRAFYRTFRVAAEATIGKVVYELGNGQWNIVSLRELLEGLARRDGAIEDFEVEHVFENIGARIMLLNARRTEGEFQKKHLDLRAHAEELTRFNRVAVGRESRMIELKREVNELRRRLGEPERYPLDFGREETTREPQEPGEER